MKKISAALIPIIAIDRRARQPLHRQIYEGYRTAILRGELRGGQQVPSTRLLARELAVSRIPVISAYAELMSEGYFESRSGAGTYVSRSLPEHLTICEPRRGASGTMRAGMRAVSRRSSAITPIDRSPWIRGRGAFSIGQLALDQFPLQIWSRLVARNVRNLRSSSLNYGDTAGRGDLRSAIATYLRSSRAVHCEPEQIIVVSGSQQALQISALALLDPGQQMWMEDPGYWLAQRVFSLAGARLIPVPVDEEGLNVTAGIRLCRKARLAFVTPSHQFPLGVTMSLSRRIELLTWAQAADAWIIEDDYDSEFRYESRPIASLQGLDPHSRVVYIGTFSKVLFPSMRTGYMVVPADLVERFLAVRQAIDVGQSDLYQLALAEFIEAGHFARHIRRMRALYGERRDVLVNAIAKHFGSELQINGASSGMHLTVTLPPGHRDVEIARRAAERSLWLWPLSPAYLGPNPREGFMLGFGAVPTQEIPRAVRLLREVIGGP